MDFSRQFIYDNEDIVRDLKHDIESRLRSYWDALTWFFGELFKTRLPDDWREQWHAVVAEQARRGYITDPQSVRDVEEYIAAWAKYCELEPKKEHEAAKYTITIEHHDERDVVSNTQPPRIKPLSPTWPTLSQKERDESRRATGLPWWYPFQLDSHIDVVWEVQFENVAREARSQLLHLFWEAAVMGRMGVAIRDSQHVDLARLNAQRSKMWHTYSRYVRARTDILLLWARYVRRTWVASPQVVSLIHKIDASLPVSIEGFRSPYDNVLEMAMRSVSNETARALGRAEGTYTAAVWTNWVATAVQLVSLIGTLAAGAKQIALTALAKGATYRSAVAAGTRYFVIQLVVAVGTGVLSSRVIPAVLEEAGLDPTEVEIGFALYASVGTISSLATRPLSSRIAQSGRQGNTVSRQRPGASPKSRTVVFIEGVVDSPRTSEHKLLQQSVAEDMSTSGDYVRVGMGVLLSKFSGRKISKDIKPDNIGLTPDGQIDMIEIKSPSQRIEWLEAKLTEAMNELPADLRGQWTVIDPDRKLTGN